MTATASVQAPAGWQCSKQYNGRPRSDTFTCTAAALAAGASADFAVRVHTSPTPAGRVIVVQGSARSPTPDAHPAANPAQLGPSVLESTRSAAQGKPRRGPAFSVTLYLAG